MPTFDDAIELSADLPGLEMSTSYGTPALKVKGKLFARLWGEDGDVLVVRCDLDERPALVEAMPDTLFVTAHYEKHPWMLVRLSVVTRDELQDLLEEAWRLRAPKRLAAELDGA